jgi:hypothetical protein
MFLHFALQQRQDSLQWGLQFGLVFFVLIDDFDSVIVLLLLDIDSCFEGKFYIVLNTLISTRYYTSLFLTVFMYYKFLALLSICC